jgi:hypothetical protein
VIPTFLGAVEHSYWTEMMLNYNLTLSNDTIALYVATFARTARITVCAH